GRGEASAGGVALLASSKRAPVPAVGVILVDTDEPGESTVGPRSTLTGWKVAFRQQERAGGIVHRVRVLQALPLGPPAPIHAREESPVSLVPHRFPQECAPVAHQLLVSLARHGPVQQREGDGRARRVLEGLVLWPDG